MNAGECRVSFEPQGFERLRQRHEPDPLVRDSDHELIRISSQERSFGGMRRDLHRIVPEHGLMRRCKLAFARFIEWLGQHAS